MTGKWPPMLIKGKKTVKTKFIPDEEHEMMVQKWNIRLGKLRKGKEPLLWLSIKPKDKAGRDSRHVASLILPAPIAAILPAFFLSRYSRRQPRYSQHKSPQNSRHKSPWYSRRFRWISIQGQGLKIEPVFAYDQPSVANSDHPLFYK